MDRVLALWVANPCSILGTSYGSQTHHSFHHVSSFVQHYKLTSLIRDTSQATKIRGNTGTLAENSGASSERGWAKSVPCHSLGSYIYFLQLTPCQRPNGLRTNLCSYLIYKISMCIRFGSWKLWEHFGVVWPSPYTSRSPATTSEPTASVMLAHRTISTDPKVLVYMATFQLCDISKFLHIDIPVRSH